MISSSMSIMLQWVSFRKGNAEPGEQGLTIKSRIRPLHERRVRASPAGRVQACHWRETSLVKP